MFVFAYVRSRAVQRKATDSLILGSAEILFFTHILA